MNMYPPRCQGFHNNWYSILKSLYLDLVQSWREPICQGGGGISPPPPDQWIFITTQFTGTLSSLSGNQYYKYAVYGDELPELKTFVSLICS